MTTQDFIGAVIRGVDNIASFVISDMLSNAPTSDTADAMSVSQTATPEGANSVKATISIDLDKAPEALAYEFGSGIHGSKAKKYPIEAKNADAMVFDWSPPIVDERTFSLPWITFDGSKGKIMFNRNWTLMHPGVKAKPYIRPAIEKATKNLDRLLGKELGNFEISSRLVDNYVAK